MTTTYAPKTITEKQGALLTRLRAEREIPSHAAIMLSIGEERSLTVKEASALIEMLMAAPRRTDLPATAQAEPGYYVTAASEVLVVVSNKAGTGTYAKRLVITTPEDDEYLSRTTAKWVYAPGLGKTLAGMVPLTAEEAGRLGHMHGVCVICTKPLTDPVSVQRGIGPVCVKRLSA